MMERSFSKSVSSAEKLKKLFEVVSADDIVAILINACDAVEKERGIL